MPVCPSIPDTCAVVRATLSRSGCPSLLMCAPAQTYLEQNEGPGLQHLALKTDDIFTTMRALKAASGAGGGFDFMPPASEDYYRCSCLSFEDLINATAMLTGCFQARAGWKGCACLSLGLMQSSSLRSSSQDSASTGAAPDQPACSCAGSCQRRSGTC